MNTTITRRTFVLLGAFTLAAFLPATAARADRMSELQERFKNRLPQLRAGKSSGTIGETAAGFVEAVEGKQPDEKLRKVVDEENADRRELYKLIAEKEKTTDDKVAERNGIRNFEKAGSGEMLKDKDARWRKKK
jgi:uncharacterized protein YdbL (DUF1318 family)